MQDQLKFLYGIFMIVGSLVHSYIANMLAPPNHLDRPSPILDGKYNDDLYTRGKIHYLSMDFGMKTPCWNETVKPLLQLGCPNLLSHPKVELEMAFYLTSCFCQSIGSPKLTCEYLRDPKEYENDEDYVDQIVDCAEHKCFNQYNHDAFDAITSRMPDLCYFFEYESRNHHEMKPFIVDGELKRLIRLTQGNVVRKEPRLYHLEQVIHGEFEFRENIFRYWFNMRYEEFWQNFEDSKYVISRWIDEFTDYCYYYFDD